LILEAMLRHQYPQEKFEVITTAMTAINSHVILPIAKDCARHDADLFVAYMGNNEVVGPYGAGTVFAPLSDNLSFIRFDIIFKATKVGQLLTSMVGWVSGSNDVSQVWRGLAMFMGNQIRADDPRLETVYQHFQKNLEYIEQVARRNNAWIIFCTVGSNLKDCPPFASLHRPNLTESEKTRWEDIYQQAVAYETAGQYTQAIERYLSAAQIDDCYADLQFRLGRCYEMIGNYDKAREYYIQARELDTLRFRADNRINEIIRAVAGNKTVEGVCLVDAVKVFEEHSSHKTTGHNLFYEHVHLNFEGNYLLAKTVFEQVEKILPERIKRQRANARPMLTLTECARDLAYTDCDKYDIAYVILNSYIKTPPFTNQLYHKEQVEQMEQKLKEYKDNLTPKVLEEADIRYRSAIENNKDDWFLHKKYGEFLNRGMKDYRAAVVQHYIALEYIDNYWIHVGLGELLGKLGNLDAAIEHNLKAIQMNPSYTKVHYNLAESYQKKGQIDEAIEHYYKMLHSHPDSVMAYHNLGMLLCQQDKVDEAVKLYHDGLPFALDSALMHHNYGCLLARQGHKQEAIEELHIAEEIDPEFIPLSKKVEELLNK
jgi:tetratricopeptide (TPR) repeat protein